MNFLRTGLLLVVMGSLAVAIGGYFFGVRGAAIGLVVALIFQSVAFFNGHKMALRMARAVPIQEVAGRLEWLIAANEQLAQRAGIPAPSLYISPDPQPNAFAAGRNPSVAVVCINEGLFRIMSRDEVIAVLAHEIAHVRNRDSLIMTVTASFATFISFLANIAWLIPRGDNEERNPIVDLLVMLLAPITATLIQLAVSRTREFSADRTAAELMGNPRPMIGALEALERGIQMVPSPLARAETAHMYIASPFVGGGLMNLFRTHPSTEDRIRALSTVR
jgi:heat shock protein HtpX